jgi:hypothetical protein
MLYGPDVPTSAELDIAQAPLLGGEIAIYVTRVPCLRIGTFTLSAAATVNAAGYVDNGATALPADPGCDLQLLAETGFDSTAAFTATIDGTGVTDPTLAGIGRIAPASWIADSSFGFQAGAATDIITAASEKYKTGAITLGAITGGSRNARFSLWQLPAATDWKLIGCTDSPSYNPKTRKSKFIACGMNEGAFNKPGMRSVGSLSFESKLISNFDGLSRHAGMACSVMFVALKENQLTTDRVVFSRWVPEVKKSGGTGDGEATVSAEGNYEELFEFGGVASS